MIKSAIKTIVGAGINLFAKYSTMKYILLCCLSFGVAFADPSRVNATRSGNFLKNVAKDFETMNEEGRIMVINEFVDMALEEAREFMIDYGYDPMEMPDLYERIRFKPIFITYWGAVSLSNGWLQGASTIHRNGDVLLEYTDDRVLKMTVPIAFEDFVFDYQYKLKIIGLERRGGIDGKSTNIRVKFTLELDFNDLQLELSKFDIVRIGKIKLTFNGNMLTDWMVNIMSVTITPRFRDLIKWVCEIIVRDVLRDIVDAVNDILAKIPIPEAGSLIPAAINYQIS